MEITSTALVSLACLLSNESTDQDAAQDFLKRLSVEQTIVLEEILEGGACLPKSFENKIQTGLSAEGSRVSPTTDL